MSKLPILSDGLPQLLDVLPRGVREKLIASPHLADLIEVVLDYGRPAEARYRGHVDRWHQLVVTELDIDHVVKSIGAFSGDNRAGIERTLHRISAIRNRQGKVVGLTCRVGRPVEGTIDIIDDIVRSGKSILLLGKPGVGKTTKLREVARVLADEVNMRVVIVDTSNEIGGDGDVPHPAVGNARRMQVPDPSMQHGVMIEAVENHMPEVIVIDEIGNEAEAQASRTIAERGVQLVATAHGGTLENLMLNPSLCDLVGGIQAVTLSDDEAKRRGTQKTVLERKAPPTFDVVIELLDYDRLAVHHSVQKTVDSLLRGLPPRPEVRVRTGTGGVEVVQEERPTVQETEEMRERFPSLGGREEVFAERESADAKPRRERERKPRSDSPLRVFPYGIARTRLERAIRERKLNAVITNDIFHADAVIAIRTTVQNKPAKLRDLGRNVPTFVVKSNTFSQIAGALDDALKGRGTPGRDERVGEAIQEVNSAIEQVKSTGRPIELAPADARIRKQQHQVVERNRLRAESVGQDPERRVRVSPVRSS
ncbi:MAG: AAA family ATPase [Fimbriimonadaceae bacterium]|nr:AAA family ATPase [Fimbriimonadaceae bacterium]